MVQIVSECEANFDHGGAAIVAITFLSIFAVLIAGDAVLSALAIKAAIDRGRLPIEAQLHDASELLRAHGSSAPLAEIPTRRHAASTVVSGGGGGGGGVRPV